MSVLTFEDGHIEYWSVQYAPDKIECFDSQREAAQFDLIHNCGFTPWGGVYFHKEEAGFSLLPSDRGSN